MRLSENDIAVWIAHLDDADEAGLEREWRDLLDAHERARELRYRLVDDRRRHLLARALARTALARHTGIAAQRLRFGQGRHGKPELAGDNPGDHRFNLSHAGRLVVLAVARGRALGVDTESLRSRALSMGAAERNFAACEIADLRALHGAARARRTIEYWTLKEAYVKARGAGLALPLDGFGFRFDAPACAPDARLQLWMRADFDDAPARWRLWQFLGADDHLLAVCAERGADIAAPRIELIRALPLRGETRADFRLLRASDREPAPAVAATA